MKEFRSYRSERSFRRPDRHDMRKDYALAIGLGACFLIGWLALMFLISFARGG